MKIEMWAVEKVKPYAKNPRLNDGAVDAVARSISEFGWNQPVVVDRNGVIICGHTRLKAALKLGLKEVPVHVAARLTPTQVKAYRIADNKLAELAEWNMELLPIELGELKAEGVDMELLGFTVDEAGNIMGGEPADAEPQIDRAAELNKKWKVKPGDLWQIGEHRLLCGDSTKAEDVARVMGGEKAMLMATDPPYGVAYDNSERPNPGVAKPRVANDELTSGPEMQAFLERMLHAALPHMEDHAAFYFWHPMLTQGTYVAAAAAAGILIHRQIIWVKPVLLLGRGDYHWRHELCFYGWQQGNRPPFYGPRNQDTIWEVGSVGNVERRAMGHSTPKPIGLWDKPIKNHTKPGEIVYEPFAGSGSQYVAAENFKRRCFGLELEPKFVSVCLQRMADAFPGISIKREEVQKARRGKKGKP